MVNESQEPSPDFGDLQDTPTYLTLVDLEDIAIRIAKRRCRSDRKVTYEVAFTEAMDQMRTNYNMHFIMFCGRCGTHHYYDKLTAPER